MKTIELFQEYLRKPILNFGLDLKSFKFIVHHPAASHRPKKILTPDQAFYTKKTSVLLLFRQFFGIPNIRIWNSKHDLLFTYGSLLITNRPYCVYIENGTALFNYDLTLASHPAGQRFLAWLILRGNCQRLIFMSNAAETGFLNTLKLSVETINSIKKKCTVCYPLVRNPVRDSFLLRKIQDQQPIRFLFIGTFYIKGGLEIVRSFSRLKKKYPETLLTIVTGLDMIHSEDKALIQGIPGINIFDASFNEKELYEKFYLTHDVFLYPTYRDSFGLTLLEAISSGLPIITTDQYATSEMVMDGNNGILLKNHPMVDYDTSTFVLNGRYRHPVDFYTTFFSFQKSGKFKIIEDQLYSEMEKLIKNPHLIEKYSQGSIDLYKEKFDAQKISAQIESIFEESLLEK